jgi:hypothetical protein
VLLPFGDHACEFLVFGFVDRIGMPVVRERAFLDLFEILPDAGDRELRGFAAGFAGASVLDMAFLGICSARQLHVTLIYVSYITDYLFGVKPIPRKMRMSQAGLS